ncbi:MAG: hypothetical protein J1E78_01145 [Muribaculaceae bacterium]|nr:hypothetical protein [Muribaculaceae bacterium]
MGPKFHLSPRQVDLVLKFIINIGIFKVPVKADNIMDLPDPKDIVFYEMRMAVDVSYLVTGNKKHFPKKTICSHTNRNDGNIKRKNVNIN